MIVVAPWMPLTLAAGAYALALGVWAVFARQRLQLHLDADAWWLAWHWYSGGPLQRSRADCYPEPGRRAAVALARSSAVAAVLAAECVRSGGPTDPLALLAVGYGGALAVGVYAVAVVAVACAWAHHVHYVRALHHVVAEDAGYKPNAPRNSRLRPPWPSRYIRFPRDGIYGQPRWNKARHAVIKWVLGWTPRIRWAPKVAKAISHLWRPRLDGVVVRCARTLRVGWDVKKGHVDGDVRAKLGDVNVRAVWHTEGRMRHAQFLPLDRLPELCLWSDEDVRLRMESLQAANAPLLGYADNSVSAALDYDAESPHIAVSAGIGAGKSALARLLAAQMLFHGGLVTILDPRQDSHNWARGVAGVRLAREVDEMYQACLDIGAEVTERGRAGKHLALGEKTDWQRHLVIVEELNSLRMALNAYYRNELGGPNQALAPAVHQLQSGIFKGRHPRVHFFVAAQVFTRQLLGGPATDMFYGRLLARYKQSAWKGLAEGQYVPAQDSTGWAMLCRGQDERPIRMGYIEETDVVPWLQYPGSRWVGLPHALPVGRRLPPELVHPDHRPRLRLVSVGAGPHGPRVAAKALGAPPRRPLGPHGTPVAGQLAAGGHQGADHEGQEYQGEDDEGQGAGAGAACHGVSVLPHGPGVHDDSATEPLVNRHLTPPTGGKNTGLRPHPSPLCSQSLAQPENVRRTSPWFSVRPPADPGEGAYGQVGGPGFDADRTDGGIENHTLAWLAEQAWCPWKLDTLARYARTPGNGFPAPETPADVARHVPATYAPAAVREWIEQRAADPGEPGVYVIGLGHEPDVKIGESKRLEARLDELGYGTFPAEQVVQHWFRTTTKRAAQQLERWFRGKYRHQRLGRSEKHLKQGQLARDLGDPAALLRGCPDDLLQEVLTDVRAHQA